MKFPLRRKLNCVLDADDVVVSTQEMVDLLNDWSEGLLKLEILLRAVE